VQQAERLQVPQLAGARIQHWKVHGGIGQAVDLGNRGRAKDQRLAADLPQRHQQVERTGVVIEHAGAKDHVGCADGLDRFATRDVTQDEFDTRVPRETLLLEFRRRPEHVHGLDRRGPASSAMNEYSPLTPHMHPMSANDRPGAWLRMNSGSRS